MGFEDLYRPAIVDHRRNPRHTAELADPDVRVERENVECSFDDRMAVALNVRAGAIVAVAVEPDGCAFTTASTSIMAEAILGRPLDEVATMAKDRLALLAAGADPDADAGWKDEDLGDFADFEGVRRFPQRLACVEMPWQALTEAVERAARLEA